MKMKKSLAIVFADKCKVHESEDPEFPKYEDYGFNLDFLEEYLDRWCGQYWHRKNLYVVELVCSATAAVCTGALCFNVAWMWLLWLSITLMAVCLFIECVERIREEALYIDCCEEYMKKVFEWNVRLGN